ncbi:hypothetical protein Cni_G20263 [Canna indica]|uniref:Reverse transcriptase domain-containing protein n=1 Tax=Canna indica TaxID=4628 RepID=A0AAQ3KMT6_9LILI|nr:hypothetical protein Cni_G20263 [Canna indica]
MATRRRQENTSFFHASTHIRRFNNTIHCLKSSNGEWHEGPSVVADITHEYFQSIFFSTNHVTNDVDFLSSCHKVTRRINNWLLRLVTYAETKQAVYSLNPDSAPGPDGFTGHFFHHHWHKIGSEITEAVASFFRSRKLLKSMNHTYIALIPKTKVIQDMTQLRPISLSNFIYKKISKIIVQRPQPIMDILISDNQCAFIKNRLISDNILLAHELTHYLKTKHKTKTHEMALKLDMSKAFDRLE